MCPTPTTPTRSLLMARSTPLALSVFEEPLVGARRSLRASEIRARQPSALSFETSSSLRGVPSGLVASKASVPLKPTTSQISSASSRIEMSSPQPTLMISGES